MTTVTNGHAFQLSLNDPANGLTSQLLDMAQQSVGRLNNRGDRAAVGRLRGCGPGISFRAAAEAWERQHPAELVYPFEENERVGGAIWSISPPEGPFEELPGANSHSEGGGVVKLRWESRANDLPMHSHEHSDRCIIVLEGRGFYHVSDETIGGFTGRDVRTIAARERDVFVFRRGVVHTFSTFDHPMVLLSCHLPFIPLSDPVQYELPQVKWVASERLHALINQAIQLDGWVNLSATE
ncbi:MAG: cupin domain-containing protein [Planctomycetota bacterium]